MKKQKLYKTHSFGSLLWDKDNNTSNFLIDIHAILRSRDGILTSFMGPGVMKLTQHTQ